MATSYLFVWLMLSLLTFATRQTDLMWEGRMWVWIYILAKIPGPVPAKLLALPTLNGAGSKGKSLKYVPQNWPRTQGPVAQSIV